MITAGVKGISQNQCLLLRKNKVDMWNMLVDKWKISA